MLLSFFAAFLMSAFAFTPATNANLENSAKSGLFLPMCTGTIQASVECATEDPSNATITVRNKETGALAYTGPADGIQVGLTLQPGTYVVSVATTGHCQFTVKWDFCGDNYNDPPVTVNNGSVSVGSITVE